MALSEVLKDAVEGIGKELADASVRELWADYLPQIEMVRLLAHALRLGLDDDFEGKSKDHVMYLLWELSTGMGCAEIYDAIKEADPTWDTDDGKEGEEWKHGPATDNPDGGGMVDEGDPNTD